jgi:hypothetical protein
MWSRKVIRTASAVKANRKVMNAGKMKEERVKKFNNFLVLIEENRRVNQYQ